jgi:hypothetical protein
MCHICSTPLCPIYISPSHNMDKLTTKITTQLAVSVINTIPDIFMPNLSLFCLSIYLETWGEGGPTSEHFHGSLLDASILWLSSILYIFFVPPSLSFWNPVKSLIGELTRILLTSQRQSGKEIASAATALLPTYILGVPSRGAAREKKERWTKNPVGIFSESGRGRQFIWGRASVAVQPEAASLATDNCLRSSWVCCALNLLNYALANNFVLKPNSWMYNFIEVSGHNLERSQTWGCCVDFLNHKEGGKVF